MRSSKISPIIQLALLLLAPSSHLLAQDVPSANAESEPAVTESVSSDVAARRDAAIEKARAGNKTLIILKTSCVRYAGTDSRIEARVNTPDGYSGWVELDNAGNDRERCDEDYYYVTFPPQSGTVLHLRTNSSLAGPAWRLSWAEVHAPSGFKSKKVWDIWIGDRKHRGKWCVYENAVPQNCF